MCSVQFKNVHVPLRYEQLISKIIEETSYVA